MTAGNSDSGEQSGTLRNTGTRTRIALALCLLPAVALIAWHWQGGPGIPASDWAQYMMHAQALAEGRPYGDIGYIFTRDYASFAPRVQAPGLPLLLAPAIALFGNGLVAPRLLCTAFAIFFLVTASIYVSRSAGPRIAMLVLLFAGVSLEVALGASQIQSDFLFAGLIWTLLILYDRDRPWTWGTAVAVTALGTLAIVTRLVGVALVPAAALYALVHRRERGLLPFVPVVFWAVSAVAGSLIYPVAQSFLQFSESASRIVAGLPWRIYLYRLAVTDALLAPVSWSAAQTAWQLIAVPLCVLGAVVWSKSNLRSMAALLAVCYTALLLVAPAAASRYALPFIPLLLMFLAIGATDLLRTARFAPLRAERLTVAAALLVVGGWLATGPVWRRQSSLEALPEVRELYDAVRATSVSSPMRVSFVRPLSMAYFTGVKAMPLPPRPDNAELIAAYRRACITHVVRGDLGMAHFGTMGLDRLLIRRPELFAEEFRNGSFVLLRLQGEALCDPAAAAAVAR